MGTSASSRVYARPPDARPPDPRPVNSMNESALFGMIVVDPDFRRVFHEFLKSEYSADNLEFFLAVQALQEIEDSRDASPVEAKGISEQYFNTFDAIMKKYVMEGAEMEINVQQGLRRKIMRLRGKVFSPSSIIFIRNECETVLHEAQKQVLTIMVGCLSRFQNSPVFAAYVSEAHPSRPSSRMLAFSHKRSVLVAESDETTGKLVCKKLRECTGCSTTLVHTRVDVEEALASNAFKAIVMAVDLDGQRAGQDVVERFLRAAPSSPSSKSVFAPCKPVLVGTLAKANAELQSQCLQSGFSAVLIKPYQMSALIGLLMPGPVKTKSAKTLSI